MATTAQDNDRLMAGGVVALTTLVFMLNARFDGTWGQGIHFVYTAAAAGFVIWLAAQTRVEGERPQAWQSVLYVASFALALFALARLADIFGVEDVANSSGTIVWVGLLLIGLSGWFATARNSGISLLLAVITSIVVILAFVDWVFGPDDVDTFRWILLLIAAVLLAGGFMGREDRSRAVAYVNGAGLALLALAVSFIGFSLAGIGDSGISFDAGWGWELMILTGAFALLLFSAHELQSGPGYLGVANLFAFVLLASAPGDDGPSLIGWPLVLIVLSAAALGSVFRRA